MECGSGTLFLFLPVEESGNRALLFFGQRFDCIGEPSNAKEFGISKAAPNDLPADPANKCIAVGAWTVEEHAMVAIFLFVYYPLFHHPIQDCHFSVLSYF